MWDGLFNVKAQICSNATGIALEREYMAAWQKRAYAHVQLDCMFALGLCLLVLLSSHFVIKFFNP